MKHLKNFNESRVVGFKYRNPTIEYILSFSILGNDDVTELLKTILNRINVKFNNIKRTASANSYIIEIVIYDEREVDAIIDDLSIKLMMSDQKISDVIRRKKDY